jgi:hypothetical protein
MTEHEDELDLIKVVQRHGYIAKSLRVDTRLEHCRRGYRDVGMQRVVSIGETNEKGVAISQWNVARTLECSFS